MSRVFTATERNRLFSQVTMHVTRTLSWCVLHVWTRNSPQCPDLILQVHMWKLFESGQTLMWTTASLVGGGVQSQCDHCSLNIHLEWFISLKASCLTHLPGSAGVPWRARWSLWSSYCWHWWWESRSDPGCDKWPSAHRWSLLMVQSWGWEVSS